MKGRARQNELSEQKFFRTFAMCHEYKILQHSAPFFLKVLSFFIASQSVSVSVAFVPAMHEFIIQMATL